MISIVIDWKVSYQPGEGQAEVPSFTATQMKKSEQNTILNTTI